MTRGFAMALGRAETKATGRGARTAKGRSAACMDRPRLRGRVRREPSIRRPRAPGSTLRWTLVPTIAACPTGDGFRVVDSFSRIIRLGEGISATGCISDAAIERAIAALSICRDKIQSKKAGRLRLIATEACRAASNADGFRDRVAAETGIRLEGGAR